MLALILSLLGAGGLGALTYFVGPAAMLGFGRSIFSFLAKIPWQVYAIAALAGVIAFLTISRSHALDLAADRGAKLELVCAAVRDAAGRPQQDCRLNASQIRAFGSSIRSLKGAIAVQNRAVEAWKAEAARQQAEAAKARREADKRASRAESTADRLKRSAATPPAPGAPCEPSKALQEVWK